MLVPTCRRTFCRPDRCAAGTPEAQQTLPLPVTSWTAANRQSKMASPKECSAVRFSPIVDKASVFVAAAASAAFEQCLLPAPQRPETIIFLLLFLVRTLPPLRGPSELPGDAPHFGLRHSCREVERR